MSVLNDEKSRTDLLHRLKRAEGQLRGIQRMIDDDQPTLEVASQLLAVRKALDSAHVHLTVGVVRQSLHRSLSNMAPAGDNATEGQAVVGHDLSALVDGVVGDVHSLLAKMR
jgi:DNA-binding FrmR family transcriptional regulator